tara:strand:+ start:675 stop:1028 length:354 start_codon:yes stop_codon:yes gene_type:complete
MKKIFLICYILCLTIFSAKGQSVSCQKLLEDVVQNHYSMSYTQCPGSSWLIKVEYYKWKNTGFVVAYMKNNNGSSGIPYIFCEVPENNWTKFKKDAGLSGSWGKSFHKNIMDWKCNC